MIAGRSCAVVITRSTEPTSTARWMLCTPSNSAATSEIFSARTAAFTSASSSCRSALSSGAASRRRASRPATRSSEAVRLPTSPANTTAAAGAPPSTDA